MFLPHGSFPVSINQVLQPQERITAHLENAAKLERPRYLAGRREEPKHLHEITRQPARQHADPEAPAGARFVVRVYLGEGQRGFDGEPDVAYCGGVESVERGHWGEYEFEGGEGDEEVEEELPVSAALSVFLFSNSMYKRSIRLWRSPLPETVRS